MANQDWFAKGRAALAALATFSLFTFYTQTIALAQVCEATGGATCYYVDNTGGSDTNDGSFANPWASQKNFVYYYNSTIKNANAGNGGAAYVDLQPGDYVYFRAGTYDTPYYNQDGGEGYGYRQLMFRFFDFSSGDPVTIKAYPGETVTFEGACGGSGEDCPPIHILQSNNIVVDGIDIVGGFTRGLYIQESDDIHYVNASITDVNDGDFNGDNGACITIDSGSNNYLLSNLFLKDCVEVADNAATLITTFGGNGGVIENITGEFTNIWSNGRAFLQKHGADNSTVTLRNSTFKNPGEMACIGSAQKLVVDNVLCWNDSESVKGIGINLQNFAGATYLQGTTITNFTAINMTGFEMRSFSDNNDFSGVYSITDSVFINTGSFGGEHAFINFDTYGSDSDYDIFQAAKANFTFDDNCYYSTTSQLRWAVFSALGGPYGEDGNSYTSLAAWQSGEGFDASSFVENPNIDGDKVAQSTNCIGKGYLGAAEPEPEPTANTAGSFMGVMF